MSPRRALHVTPTLSPLGVLSSALHPLMKERWLLIFVRFDLIFLWFCLSVSSFLSSSSSVSLRSSSSLIGSAFVWVADGNISGSVLSWARVGAGAGLGLGVVAMSFPLVDDPTPA